MENQQSSFMREQSGEEVEEVFEVGPIFEAVNRDPREQGSWERAIEREYQEGYEGPYQGPAHIQSMGEKIVPRRSQIPVSSWLSLMVFVFLILAFAGFITGRYDGLQDRGYRGNDGYNQPWGEGYNRPWGRGDQGYHRYGGRENGGRYGGNRYDRGGNRGPSVFEVSDTATLIVNDNHGAVHVHFGGPNQIIVTAITRTEDGEMRYIPLGADTLMSDGNTVTVDVNSLQGDAAPQVDLDITVPESANLSIHANSQSQGE